MKKTILSIFTIIILLIFPMGVSAFDTDRKEWEVKFGEALIWYLGHCGYAVKTAGQLLIFDYIELEEDSQYYYLEGPLAELKLDDMEIYTVNSHHSFVPEVAYLVKLDGLALFHGGDYQGKMGRGEASNVEDDMKYLRTKVESADIFFIGAWTGDCNIKAIERLKPKVIFPMHDRKKEERYKVFASDIKKLGVVQPVVCPGKRGDRFVYKDGKVQ